MAQDYGGAGTAAVLHPVGNLLDLRLVLQTLARYREEETSGYVANPGNVPLRRSSSDLGVDVEIS